MQTNNRRRRWEEARAVLWLSRWNIFLTALLHSGGRGVGGSQADWASALKEGDSALSRGEYSAALRHYSSAIVGDAPGALPYTKRAAVHTALGEYSAAIRDYDRAVEAEPEAVLPRLQRGRLQRRLCHFVSARADLAEVLRLKPNHAAAAKEQAEVAKGEFALEAARAVRGHPELVRQNLKGVFDVAPDCTEAKMMEAELMFDEGDYGGVVALAGQLVKGDSTHVGALLMRARAYLHIADLQLAKRHLSEALRLDPDHKPAKTLFTSLKKLQKQQAKAESAEAAGRWDDAEVLYAESATIHPTATAVNAALWVGLCRVRLQLGKGPESVEACRKNKDAYPEDADAAIYLVRALLVAEDYEGAAREGDAARRMHQQNPRVHEVYAEAERKKKLSLRIDYYKVLSVDKSAVDREVKKAYRDLARKYHPDKAEGEGIPKEEAEKKFREIAEAYEILSNEEKRAAYDRGEDLDQLFGPNAQQHQGHGFPGGFHHQHFHQGGGFHGGGGHTFHFEF